MPLADSCCILHCVPELHLGQALSAGKQLLRACMSMQWVAFCIPVAQSVLCPVIGASTCRIPGRICASRYERQFVYEFNAYVVSIPFRLWLWNAPAVDCLIAIARMCLVEEALAVQYVNIKNFLSQEKTHKTIWPSKYTAIFRLTYLLERNLRKRN